MAENNEILQLFEIFGKVGIDIRETVKNLTTVTEKAEDAAKDITRTFKDLERDISNIELSANVDTDDAVAEIERFKQQTRDMMQNIEADATIAVDSEQALKDLRRLEGQLNRMQIKVQSGDFSEATGAQRQRERVQETLSNVRQNVQITESRTVEQRFLSEIARGLQQVVTNTDAGTVQQAHEQAINSAAQQTRVQEGTQGTLGGEHVAAAVLAERLLDGVGGGGGRNLPAYDLNQAFDRQQRYQEKMLRYAQKLTAQYVLPKVTQSLDRGREAIPLFNDAQNMTQLQMAFGMVESGATNARSRLAQLGFGRTKQEIKEMQAQMYMLANTRLDDLNDQIKLTEQALEEMQSAENVEEYSVEIAQATQALQAYKNEVKELNVAQKAAETEGFKVGKFGGKNVIYEEYSTTLEKLSGKFGAMLTKDIAIALNRSYEKLDKGAIEIVGDQGTKALNKAKVNALATSFQTLGTMMMTVAPVLGILAAGVAALGAASDEAVASMQRQTLATDEEMKKHRDGMGRVQVNTGASREDISNLFVELERQGYSGSVMERKAETGLNFNKAFENVEATDAIKAVEDIQKKLGVTEDDARNILTLALDEYNGDLKTAQKEVLEHKKHWKEIKDTQIDGMKAYNKMTEGSMTTWEKMVRAAQSWGNVLDELWEQFGTVLDPILDKITEIGNATAEWMQENPNATKWIATLGVLATGLAALSAVLLPLMGFLLINRNLFQAIGQSLGLMGKGMAVVNPQAKMMLDNMTMMRNGLLGMSRLIGALGPALFGLFRSLPLQIGQMIGTFMRLNPLLVVFGGLFLLIYKNIDEYQPAFDRIGDALGRIIKSIAKAFGGDAETTTSAFASIIEKLADVTADVLVPAFELLASLLEMIAPLMENGGGKVVAFVGGLFLLASVLGGVAKGIGGLKGAFAVLISPLTGLISLLGKLKSLWPGGKSKIDVKQTKTTKNIQKNVPDGTIRTTPYVGKTPTMVPVGGGTGNVASQTVRAGKVTVHGSPVYVDGKIAGKQDIRGDKTRNTTVVPANIPAASNEPAKDSKKPKYTTTRNNHDEIPDEIRTKGDKGKSSGIGWKSVLVGLVGGELIEAMLDLNTKKAEKNLTSFLEDTQGKIEDLGGGGDEGASLRDNIENLLNGDLSDIDMDGITEIKEQVTEEMKGIFGNDVFDRISNKTPGKFKKMFGVIGKVVGRMAGFLTGPIGGILLTLIPLIWEFREPIMKALKKIGEYLPQGLVNGIKAGWKWLKGIGKWFYDKVIEPVKKFFGIASPSRVMAQIGRWIVEGLVKGIKNTLGMLKKVASWIIKPFKSIPGAMRKLLSSVKKAFTRVFSAIYRSVRTWINRTRAIAVRMTRALANGVRNAIRSLVSFFARIFKGIYKTVSKWLGAARDFAIAAMRKMRNFITKVLTYLRDLFASIFKKIYNTIAKWLSAAWDFIKKIFNKIKNFITKTLRSVLSTVTKMFKGMFDSAKKWLGKVWDKVTGIFGAIKRYLIKTARDANSWGSDIIMGIWEGMKDKAETMLGWITDLGESIADLFKKAMGIHSPSRVMRAIAKWIPIGVGLGINDGAKDVKKATRGMSDTIVKSFKPKLTTDDIMNGIVKSKQSNTRKLNLSVASAKTSNVARGTGALSGITVQNMTVNNNTERAARGFEQTTRKQLDREVRRKMR